MKQCFLLLFSILTFQAIGQKAVKWNNVPLSDIEMTAYEPDSEASAIILAETAKAGLRIKDGKGLIMRTEFHRRIKILDEAGLDRANVSLIALERKYGQVISGLKAITHNADGKYELNKKEFFMDKTGNGYVETKFSFPKAKVGSVIEYKYVLESQYVYVIPTFYFQHDIPVKYSQYEFTTIDDFIYHPSPSTAGFPFSSMDRKSVSVNLNNQYQKQNGTRFTWVAENLPAVELEKYITTIDNYRMKLDIQLSDYVSSYSFTQNFPKNWAQLNNALINDEDFGDKYLKKGSYKKFVQDNEAILAASYENNTEKVKAIYNHITDNYKWDGSYGVNLWSKLDRIHEKKEGSGNEINFLLLRLLREAGIQAYPIIMSTRKNGDINTIYPVVDQFNHVIVEVFVEEGKPSIFMDALNPNRPYNLLSASCLNGEGWRVDEKGMGRWVMIPRKKSTKVIIGKLELQEDGKVNTNLKTYYDGYYALNNRASIKKDQSEHIKKRITEDFPDIALNSSNYENTDDINQRLIETLDFEVQGAEVNGGFLYFPAMLKQGISENLFKQETRKYPIDMTSPFKEQIIMNIKIPEGYTVEELPQPTVVKLNDNDGKFTFLMKQISPTEVQVTSLVEIKTPVFSPENYEPLKQFFQLVEEKHATMLVFKKLKSKP